MKKVFKWGCMFFIVTFGISLALMLFNLPSEEEMAKIQVELELEKKEQLENFNMKAYPGSAKGPNPEDDPIYYQNWFMENIPSNL